MCKLKPRSPSRKVCMILYRRMEGLTCTVASTSRDNFMRRFSSLWVELFWKLPRIRKKWTLRKLLLLLLLLLNFCVSNGSQDATCTNHDDELRIREAIGGREVMGKTGNNLYRDYRNCWQIFCHDCWSLGIEIWRIWVICFWFLR